MTEYNQNFPATLEMEQQPDDNTKKRNHGKMLAADLAGKLLSKQDFYNYLDKHRKYSWITYLTSL